jgi:proteasomal ATPase-associated factor 1
VQKFSLHFNKKQDKLPVLCLDVTEGGLGISCSCDDSLLIWLLDDGQIRRKLDGHISDINVCKFFPSGIVGLTGGADLRIKIWSAENGSCPVTLVGHSGGKLTIKFFFY